MTMEQQIVIGKIVAPHGVRGEFRIMPLTDQPQRYAKMKIVHLDDGRDLTVVSVRQHKNVYLMMVKEITNMTKPKPCGAVSLSFPPRNFLPCRKDSSMCGISWDLLSKVLTGKPLAP